MTDISSLPKLITGTLKLENQTQEIAVSLAYASGTYFLGRVILYPSSLEEALKLEEIGYIQAGYMWREY